MSVLEDRQPRHRACRQRRPAGAVLIDRAEVLLQEPSRWPAPASPARVHVDDLVEPRVEQLLFAGLAPLARLHGCPSPSGRTQRIPHLREFRRSELQENRAPSGEIEYFGQAQTAKPIRVWGFFTGDFLKFVIVPHFAKSRLPFSVVELQPDYCASRKVQILLIIKFHHSTTAEVITAAMM